MCAVHAAIVGEAWSSTYRPECESWYQQWNAKQIIVFEAVRNSATPASDFQCGSLAPSDNSDREIWCSYKCPYLAEEYLKTYGDNVMQQLSHWKCQNTKWRKSAMQAWNNEPYKRH